MTKEQLKDMNPPKPYEITNKTCHWCGQSFNNTGFKSGHLTFCSFSCHGNWYESTHDNYYSDADPGL